jgi:Glycosyl transferases group 1
MYNSRKKLLTRAAIMPTKSVKTSTLRVATDPAAWRAVLTERIWSLKGPCSAMSHHLDGGSIPEAIYWPIRYQHPNAAAFVRPLRQGFCRMTSVESSDIAQPYEGIVVIEVAHMGKTYRVAVDYYDYTTVNRACLDTVALYFKMQHLRQGYGDSRVVPGGYIAAKQSLYDNYCRLRRLHGKRVHTDVYGRFGLRFAPEIRGRAIEILRAQNGFAFSGGTSLAPYMQSLRDAARSRICIDMPGNGPFCYRLVEYLALGCCVIGPRHATTLHSALVDGVHIVYCRDDLADLSSLCQHYITDIAAREQIADNAARYFDNHLHPHQLAKYYLETSTERL